MNNVFYVNLFATAFCLWYYAESTDNVRSKILLGLAIINGVLAFGWFWQYNHQEQPITNTVIVSDYFCKLPDGNMDSSCVLRVRARLAPNNIEAKRVLCEDPILRKAFEQNNQPCTEETK